MGSFLGGSAPGMARQICEGLTRMSPVILKRLSVDQLQSLEFELDKKLRETRGDAVDLDDIKAVTAKNRRISRIDGAIRILRATKAEKQRRRI